MKTKTTYCLLAVLMTVACAREADTEIPEGMLRANIVQPDTETRTSFDGGTGKFRWSEGDKIAIHMSTGYYTEAEVDYRTGFFECPTTESRYRNYYAVYPASIAVEDAYGNPDLDVVLPATYDISSKLTSDYSPLPMIAVNREAESDLYFNHAGGLIRIILNDVAAEAAQARVTFEHNVTGIFRVHWASEKLPYISDGGDGAVVTFQLAESTLGEVTNGIRLNVPVPTGHYGEVKVEVLNASGTALSTIVTDMDWDCARGHGKLFDLETCDYYFSVKSSLGLDANKTATQNWIDVRSYRHRNSTDMDEAVPWHVGGYFADSACETPYDGADASNAPYWLTSLGDAGSGPGSYETTAYPIVYTATHKNLVSETYPAAAQEINARIASSSFGAGSSLWNYLNLSNPLDRNSDYIAESANCYIVNGPGYYRIPLVMGNGIIENQPNPLTKTWKGGGTFKDYKGAEPVSPYLHKSSASVGVPTSAFVVWEDEEHLIEAINTVDYTLPESPLELKNDVWWLRFHVAKPVQGNAVIAVADQNGDVMWSWHIWVTDYVPKNYGGDSDITVTPADPAPQFDFMPVNLGWVVSGLERTYRYETDRVYVRFVQEGSGNTRTMIIGRTSVTDETKSLFPHYEPLFQWGRKDALHPALEAAQVPSCYGRFPALTVYEHSESYVIHLAIRHPQKMLKYSSYRDSWFLSGNNNAWNAFSNETDIDNSPVVKTIYDPCPVGYCMPPTGAFTGFWDSSAGQEKSALLTTNVKDLNGDGTIGTEDFDGGWYFYTDGTMTDTVFLPVVRTVNCFGNPSCRYGGLYAGVSYNEGWYHNAGFVSSFGLLTIKPFRFFENVGLEEEQNGWGCAVRPVAEKKEVFGGSGSGSGATTTGVQVDIHDMSGNIWE